VNDLYKEKYKHLKKVIEEDYRRWKDLLCSRSGRINIVKIAIPVAMMMRKVLFLAARLSIIFSPETERL
jgi:hypothetical protein